MLNTTLLSSSSNFILPFRGSASATDKLNKDAKWQKEHLNKNPSPDLYFSESIKNLLKLSFAYSNPCSVTFTWRNFAFKFEEISLFVLPADLFILRLRPILEEDSLKAGNFSVADLLDFNESFRFLGDLYPGHDKSRKINAQIGADQSNGNIHYQKLEELLEGLLKPVFGQESQIKLQRIFDERMIVFSLALLKSSPDPRLAYKFYNVDTAGMDLPSEEHRQNFLKENVYRRWPEIQYGFTHYSGCCIACGNTKEWISDVFNDIYSYIPILLFYRYSRLLQIDKFLREAYSTSPINLRLVESIISGYKRFMVTEWFDDITTQDQGNELFQLWQGILARTYGLKEILDYKMWLHSLR